MHLPEKLEVGTLGVPAIIALEEGIKHIVLYGQKAVTEKCSCLEKRITDSLSDMKNVTVYGKTKKKVSTILFNIDGLHSEETAMLLSQNSICVRAGLHCAPLCHKALGTLESGAVRVSASHFNSGEDIESFLREVQKIAK